MFLWCFRFALPSEATPLGTVVASLLSDASRVGCIQASSLTARLIPGKRAVWARVTSVCLALHLHFLCPSLYSLAGSLRRLSHILTVGASSDEAHCAIQLFLRLCLYSLLVVRVLP